MSRRTKAWCIAITCIALVLLILGLRTEDNYVFITNETTETFVSGEVSACEAPVSVSSIGPTDERQIRFKVRGDCEAMLRLTSGSGAVREIDLGYVTLGLPALFRVSVLPGKVTIKTESLCELSDHLNNRICVRADLRLQQQ